MSDLKDFVIENGVLKRYMGTEESVTIPDCVKKIARYAFPNYKVKEITIPHSVKEIQVASLSRGATIYAQIGSAAEVYAKKNSGDHTFVPIGTPITTKPSAAEPKGKVSPLKAMAMLEDAILNKDGQKVAQIVEKYKTFELPSRALGLACRTGQLDIVQFLVKNKFNFTYKTTDKPLNSKYALYYKPSSYKYHADFSLLMVVNDIWDRYLFGYMEKHFPPEDLQIKWVNNTERIVSEIPERMTLGSSKDRAEVVRFLYSKKKISDVKCKLMLYYAILENDTEMIETLDSLGATVDVAWLDAAKYDASYVSEYRRFLEIIAQKATDVQQNIFVNLNRFMKKAGCKFNLRENVFEAIDGNHNADLVSCVLENADTTNVNKKKLLKSLIISEADAAVIVAFLHAGFADTNVLCELIDLSNTLGRTELQLVLMDYKNQLTN